MHKVTGRLAELVQALDALGPKPTLVELADTIAATKVTLADVQDFVRENPRSYNRALVALRPDYELLVMTWRPGQASPPHDHAGSICVMQVLAGDAHEGSYRVAADGYVDADYETAVPCGEITAGQDAGVHTVRNDATANGPLVTVHVYAPPLKDFRRFVARPKAPTPNFTVWPEGPPTIVVVGGGFSGAITAAQIVRAAHAAGPRVKVVVVERRGAVGEGVAYGTREIVHLLNVPAGRMSAWPDNPDDFVRWASGRHGPQRPDAFLPRLWYGQYVRESLVAAAEAAKPLGELAVLYDEVRRVARRPDGGWLVHLERGLSLPAAGVVLAVGHRPPSDPIGRRWSGPRTRFIGDPWRPFAMSIVEPEDSVVILGAGLTAIDAVLSLAHPERRGPITILSRRGLLPHAHAATPPATYDWQPLVTELSQANGGVRALALLRGFRKALAAQSAAGRDWRGVVDGLRPHTAKLWSGMPAGERRRFLARLQPFWEIHRHRMALGIAERFGDLRDCDWVRRAAGRIVSVQAEADAVQVLVAERGTGKLLEIDADWVVNCTGPTPSNTAAANPAIGSLLVDGWLLPDELGLGVETDAAGQPLAADGSAVADLFVVGTLRKPALWESTAVPELRVQAAEAARLAVALLQGRPATATHLGVHI
jgi:uncharacterized NAD(P)/FAD-binding protein YdhS/predicted metal-dependent enzyme (double-stranded beta helix superfamily)